MDTVSRIEALIEKARPGAGAAVPRITADTLLVRDLGLSSFDMLVLLYEVEGEFEIDIAIAEVPQHLTVGELARLVDMTVDAA